MQVTAARGDSDTGAAVRTQEEQRASIPQRVKLGADFQGGSVTVPASKSIAHRSVLAASLANGTSDLAFTSSKDLCATLNGIQQLGTDVTKSVNGHYIIKGMGGIPHRRMAEPLDCGESGSTLRFLIPLFSLTGYPVTFQGHGRLLARPQEIYADIFRSQGLMFTHSPERITIAGALRPGRYAISGAVSSQFITGLLYALPLMDGNSSIEITPPFESRSYVELTTSVLRDFGVRIEFQNDHTIFVPGGQTFDSVASYSVEGDFSQAAFFLVLGSLLDNVSVRGLKPDSMQGDRVILDILRGCGADLSCDGADIICRHSTLTAFETDLRDCPDLGPILMTMAFFCRGQSVIHNAGRLRLKESDRIAAMQTESAKLGGVIEAQGDTLFIKGTRLHGSEQLDSHNDHRIAMSLAVAALAAGAPSIINGANSVAKSYPDFFRVLEGLGAKVTPIADR